MKTHPQIGVFGLWPAGVVCQLDHTIQPAGSERIVPPLVGKNLEGAELIHYHAVSINLTADDGYPLEAGEVEDIGENSLFVVGQRCKITATVAISDEDEVLNDARTC